VVGKCKAALKTETHSPLGHAGACQNKNKGEKENDFFAFWHSVLPAFLQNDLGAGPFKVVVLSLLASLLYREIFRR
jgi:hypothetical protein